MVSRFPSFLYVEAGCGKAVRKRTESEKEISVSRVLLTLRGELTDDLPPFLQG